MVGIFSLVTGWPGPSGFGSATTAEQVTEGIDASNLTVIITVNDEKEDATIDKKTGVAVSNFLRRVARGCFMGIDHKHSRTGGIRGWVSHLQSIMTNGGASGIGAETARVAALRGAHVIIAARNMEAANETKELIVSSNSAARVDAMKLDLNSLKSVRSFADNFVATGLPLNILINNAGVMFCPYQLSEDGVEMQFATNHLGHFYLTNLLLDKIKRTAKESGVEGRIVNLSSIAHLHTYPEGIQFDGINERSRYNEKKAYGQSKLANILHANELSRRLQEERANVTVNSVHPGIIMTNLMRHSVTQMKVLKIFTYMFWKNVQQGAATPCYAALHPSLKGITGKYFLDCNEKEPSNLAKNEKLAKQLWAFSEELVKSAHPR